MTSESRPSDPSDFTVPLSSREIPRSSPNRPVASLAPGIETVIYVALPVVKETGINANQKKDGSLD